MREPEDFREFVLARSPVLLRTAWMFTGDAHLAEDLLQTALARTWPHWERVRHGNPEAYVRTVMVRTHASWRRRLWHREKPTADLGMLASTEETTDRSAQVDERLALASALDRLPVRQRQVVVLRFFDDLPVEAVAQIMSVSQGTVKSQTSKALSALRTFVQLPALVEEEL